MTTTRPVLEPADQPVTYRELAQSELETAAELLRTYLPGCVLSDVVDAGSRVLGAFIDGELVACLHWSRCEALWFGRAVPIARTGPGATAPEQRRRGVMRALLHRALGDMRAAGIMLAGQETPVIGYHRRTGWEIATFARRHVADRSAVVALDANGLRCRLARPDDAPAVHAVWESHVRARRFASLRGLERWRGWLGDGSWWVAVDEIGSVKGCARRSSPDGRADSDTLRIAELVTGDVITARALLSTLASAATVRNVEWWTAPDDDGRFVLGDPRAVAVTDEIDKLLRVVDAAVVLDRLTAGWSGAPPEVTVLDGLCEWNNRAFSAASEQRGSKMEPPQARLHLDTRALSALASGAIGPEALAAAGLLEPPDAPALHQLAVGAHLPPWHPDSL